MSFATGKWKFKEIFHCTNKGLTTASIAKSRRFAACDSFQVHLSPLKARPEEPAPPLHVSSP